MAGIVQPTLEKTRPWCWVIRAAGSSKSRLALAPGSDPESASSFLRGASSWRPGHPVCGPRRSAARNWRWPRPPRRTHQARTPGRPVRLELCHALFLVRSDSAFFEACRAVFACARRSVRHTANQRWHSPNDRKWPEIRDRPQPTRVSDNFREKGREFKRKALRLCDGTAFRFR